jgi:hypothetical protein
MGAFSDRTSMDRILFAASNHEKQEPGRQNPLQLTQTFDVTAIPPARFGHLEGLSGAPQGPDCPLEVQFAGLGPLHHAVEMSMRSPDYL